MPCITFVPRSERQYLDKMPCASWVALALQPLHRPDPEYSWPYCSSMPNNYIDCTLKFIHYQVQHYDIPSRIISSFALRSFHKSALALQNGVPYAPAQGHTREPAQQGYPTPRTSNDGRDARQLALGLAQDRHLQLPDVHASLAQKLVGPQYYRTVGSA